MWHVKWRSGYRLILITYANSQRRNRFTRPKGNVYMVHYDMTMGFGSSMTTLFEIQFHQIHTTDIVSKYIQQISSADKIYAVCLPREDIQWYSLGYILYSIAECTPIWLQNTTDVYNYFMNMRAPTYTELVELIFENYIVFVITVFNDNHHIFSDKWCIERKTIEFYK